MNEPGSVLHDSPPQRVHEYAAVAPWSDGRVDGLSSESQAALRQFTPDRLIGYGVDRADALELSELVLRGRPWLTAATDLAERCLRVAGQSSRVSRISLLRRASALLRASQSMMLADTVERRAIYARAAELSGQAAVLARDRTAVLIDAAGGPLAGWHLATAEPSVGAAIVIGGVEGYAMDFDCIGEALTARGIEALMLDAPGQGETRFAYSHYLRSDWAASMSSAIDYLEAAAPGRPIGLIGNSMGGAFAMAVAVADRRVRACVNNGGIPAPWLVPPSIGTFYTKMLQFCGGGGTDVATTAWTTVVPLASGPNVGYPLLTIHGGADPLVSSDMAHAMFAHAPTADKQMITFDDGVHCVYNHKSDRDAVIADWMHGRLASGQGSAE